jgi:hypothetical protein
MCSGDEKTKQSEAGPPRVRHDSGRTRGCGRVLGAGRGAAGRKRAGAKHPHLELASHTSEKATWLLSPDPGDPESAPDASSGSCSRRG